MYFMELENEAIVIFGPYLLSLQATQVGISREYAPYFFAASNIANIFFILTNQKVVVYHLGLPALLRRMEVKWELQINEEFV